MSFEAVSKQVNLELIKSIACLSEEEQAFKDKRDQELRNVMTGKDQRFLLVIGPCSADNEEAVLEYAKKLAAIQEKVKDKIFIVQRVYTGKPRTNGDGYKGMLHQQDPNGETNLIRGMVAVRKLHKRVIVEAGLTTADEMLYPENLVFVDDLVSYHAVGARSVEDQQHRFVASGIDAPTGLKNPTSGNMKVLFNSLHAAQRSQEFIFSGSEVKTSGNELAHVILRGALSEQGQVIPNYHYEDLLKAVNAYKADDYQNPFIIVDTNHDNSGKQYLEQIRIVKEVLINRAWNEDIKQMVRGFMIESYLEDGRQDISEGTYGKSITDPCLGWAKTEELIQYIYENI
ncbi:3-deoxy-7-phosphoheptulonate synthase [Enterococcus cecorum]|uniref:3-deoxy-7-phosphoheptulonate synthase n=1 Tax=Enterococcus cecorum TaxID=44008 RepID=UPI001FAC3C05|nr:3-deoxy-7-phosphoheptulonate synthase [Enterococcus cecorum]MCJ0538246.1 3-deoxy-7-phosphoheptulonate synthase [Enterococcus cecorum]MCJ0546569.1 3-deoxy-7-phosphoheptulonate synthase [Enterococcus cecorum]MCJ0550042.1 3-deoxy-7-phosphoheptulonate synthase [Enterococcus cecorum]MCJ0568401.1 3-deoxy-7-phosphoheptulonate synthase [Enterococcus cecorum]